MNSEFFRTRTFLILKFGDLRNGLGLEYFVTHTEAALFQILKTSALAGVI